MERGKSAETLRNGKGSDEAVVIGYKKKKTNTHMITIGIHERRSPIPDPCQNAVFKNPFLCR
jgi:hypothetical protein